MAETRPQKVFLKVFGSEEVLENPSLIDYYRLHQVDEIYFNKLLGDFSPEGKYDIPEETKKLLIKVKKLITEVPLNAYLATSELKYVKLNFSVKYWKGENNQGVANLYLVEKLNDAELVCFIAQYVSEYGEDFKERVKKAFNLFNEVEEFEDEYSQKIDEIFEQQKQKQAEREYIVEIQAEFYIKEMLKLLENSGDQGKAVLAEFKPHMENTLAQTNKSGVFALLRLNLDRLIIKHGGFNKFAEENPDFIKVSLIFSKPVKRFDTVSKKLDDAQAPKPYQAAKPASGGAKKSGPSKPIIVIPKAKNKLQEVRSYIKMPGGGKGGANKNISAKITGPQNVELPKDGLSQPVQAPQPVQMQEVPNGNFKDMLLSSADGRLDSCAEKSLQTFMHNAGKIEGDGLLFSKPKSHDFDLSR